MEPILLTTAILSQFQTSTLIGTIFAGIVGNRADTILCNATNKLYGKIKDQIDKPVNHDIQRAVRCSYLKATLLAVKHDKSKFKHRSRKPSDHRKIEVYIKDELKKLANSNVHFPETDLNKNYEYLLSPKGGSASELLPHMIRRLKESLFEELQQNKFLVGPTLRDHIFDGWKDNNKEVDWYELICAFFAEELKANQRLSTIIQTNYLDGISAEVGEVKISISEIQEQLQDFFDDYVDLLPKVDQLVATVERTEQKIDDLPKKMREIIKEEMKNRPGIHQLPDFTLPGRHQELLEEIEKLNQDEREIKLEIADLIEELKETEAKTKKKNRKERMLDRAEAEFLRINKEKNQVEDDLETFISNVLQLAEHFSKKQAASTTRLKQAQALFIEGKYEEADKVLNEKDIYEDIKNHRKKSRELAEELIVKAQTTTINKKQNWFEIASKYYKDATDIDKSYDTCFACAYFMQNHRQISDAIHYYVITKKYVENEVNKALILNNLGILQRAIQQLEEAGESYAEALAIRRKLARQNPQAYLPSVATTLNNLGLLQQATQQLMEAGESYAEALAIRRKLAGQNPQAYLPDLAVSLNNMGVLQQATQQLKEAGESYAEALPIYRKLAGQNPQAYLPDVAWTLNNLAGLQKAIQQLKEAGESYAEALAIRRKLAGQNPQAYLPSVATTLNNLAGLQQVTQQQLKEAEKSFNEALQIRRTLAEQNPHSFSVYCAQTAVNMGNFYRFSVFQKEKSTSYAKEAIQRVSRFVNKLPYADELKNNAEEILAYWENKSDDMEA